MNQDIVIKVEHVSKSFEIPQEQRNTMRERILNFRKNMIYENFNALDDVSFEIKRGEFFSIIGRNGSGKSTLLKILAGIYTPNKGSVLIDGEISPFLELGVGFNPELSGKDNIYLNGTILGLTKYEIDRDYNKIVSFAELSRFIHLKVKNYSSGMQVRLAFSVAIHADKEILLMDEVLAVGDANFQVKCYKVFEDFIKEGKTIVFVSHDPSVVQKYSNRVLYLESGKPAFLGRPDEALSKYMYTDVIKETPGAENVDKKLVQEKQVPTDQGTDNASDQDHQVFELHQSPDERQKFVEISSVQIVNDKGVETKNLLHGDPFYIHVHYKITEDLDNLIFDIVIFNQQKRAIFSTSTYSEKIKTGKIGKGNMTVTFKIMNYFASGKYFISAKVSDETQRIFYDWKEEIKAFWVSNIKRLISFGGVDLPHEISIKKDQTKGN